MARCSFLLFKLHIVIQFVNMALTTCGISQTGKFLLNGIFYKLLEI
jgi:hypothetical protein